jgi:glutamate-1-semialdehyde 2,1-aminomutase
MTRNSSLDAALQEAKEGYAAANPISAAQPAARAAMPGGNTRTVLHYDPFPLTFARGEGARLWDLDGHEYADFLGEFTAGVAGHSHPAIRRAVAGAMEGGINLGGHNMLEGRFAAAVQARWPAMERLRFTNSGTEANLLALSTAVAVTGKRQVMVFAGGYHGAVFVFSGGANINAPFDWLVAPYNDAQATLALLEANASTLAAVILEPMLGGGGCIPATADFLHALREATARLGVLLVFDEVMTSRLAPGGLGGAHGVAPDLMTLGKYVGGGMSFGAFGGRAELIDRYDPARPFPAWLRAIALNKCRDRGRRLLVRRLVMGERSIDAPGSPDYADAGPGPETTMLEAQEAGRLEAAIASLPTNLKEPLILTYLDGFSQQEAAKILDVSIKTIETRAYRARKRLAELLGEH